MKPQLPWLSYISAPCHRFFFPCSLLSKFCRIDTIRGSGRDWPTFPPPALHRRKPTDLSTLCQRMFPGFLGFFLCHCGLDLRCVHTRQLASTACRPASSWPVVAPLRPHGGRAFFWHLATPEPHLVRLGPRRLAVFMVHVFCLRLQQWGPSRRDRTTVQIFRRSWMHSVDHFARQLLRAYSFKATSGVGRVPEELPKTGKDVVTIEDRALAKSWSSTSLLAFLSIANLVALWRRCVRTAPAP